MRNIHYLLFIILCFAACAPKADHLTILHTNDTHSQVEPKSNGQGGYARRMGLIRQERLADKHLLLVDAGDFCQGTPYFNFYHGRVEIDAMNLMGYDAATLGNHEFDNGLDTLAAVLATAQFPIVCANYDFSGTVMEGKTKPSVIIRKGGLKIGVFGLGCDPKGLIADKNFLPAKYLDPYTSAQEAVDKLRAEKCDIVVCLSHLGTYGKAAEDVCDVQLVQNTRGIDAVIGGHTHKLYDNLRVPNLDGDSIPVCQMGKSGAYLGKIVLGLGDKNEK
jgi:5'-nucleotidase